MYKLGYSHMTWTSVAPAHGWGLEQDDLKGLPNRNHFMIHGIISITVPTQHDNIVWPCLFLSWGNFLLLQGSSFTVKFALSLLNSFMLCKSLWSFIMIFSAKDISSYSFLATYCNILLELVEACPLFVVLLFFK